MDTLVKLMLQSIFEEGLFHADPHPSNVFVLLDGRHRRHALRRHRCDAPRPRQTLTWHGRVERRLRSLSHRRRQLYGTASRRAAAFVSCESGADMNTLRTFTLAVASLCASSAVLAQNGNMMGGTWGGGWMGGYGGVWMPILAIAVVVGVAVMVIRRK
jgi:hypothetical protein